MMSLESKFAELFRNIPTEANGRIPRYTIALTLEVGAVLREHKLLAKIVKDLEWSEGRTGQSTGSGLDNGSYYPDCSCPECGGIKPGASFLQEYRDDYEPGHRSGCLIAEALGRKTVILDGESGSLAL